MYYTTINAIVSTISYQEVFLKNRNSGAAAAWKGRESNRDIERKYIRPRIRSYSYRH